MKDSAKLKILIKNQGFVRASRAVGGYQNLFKFLGTDFNNSQKFITDFLMNNIFTEKDLDPYDKVGLIKIRVKFISVYFDNVNNVITEFNIIEGEIEDFKFSSDNIPIDDMSDFFEFKNFYG